MKSKTLALISAITSFTLFATAVRGAAQELQQDDSALAAAAGITDTSATISIAPSAASVPSGGTQQFTATNSAGGGLNWRLQISYYTGCWKRCVLHIAGCIGCGTISPARTENNKPTTYTAPATPYRFPQGAQLPRLQLIADSGGGFNDGYALITILPILISITPNPATVPLNEAQLVSANVSNDGTNKGVTWSLEQNGIACSPACGTISPTKTASGAATKYTAPATSPALPVVTLVATAVEDPTKSSQGTEILTTSTGGLLCDAGSGKESLFKGQYAFLFQAFGSLAWGGMGIAGSVTANGSGKITGGEEDIILDSGASEVSPTISTTASLYAVGPDHRGCLMLADTNGATTFLRFVLGSVNASGIATAAHIIQFGGSNGAATRAAGSLRLQDPTSFAADKFKGKYAFGTVGRTPTIPGTAVIGSLAIAGTFESDGASAIPSANMDMNLGGVITSDVSSVGNFQCCDANGRGNGGFSDTNIGFVIYQINSADAFFMLNNDGWGAQGEAIGISSATKFSQSSLYGNAVLRETAQSPSGPAVNLALASANGIDAITMSECLNDAGIFSASKAAMTYQVAPNGRVTFAGSSAPPVLYLHGPNQGFWLGTDANVTFGNVEPQAAGPFHDASFSGAYMFGTENPSASTVTLESGVVTATGSGHATGTSDLSSPVSTQNQSLNFSYSFSADGIGNVGSGTTAILISPSKLAFINNSSANPTITVVEK